MALSVEIIKKLDNFRLEVQFDTKNESLALLGASGSGKSLTLRCISGVLAPDEGRIILDGTVLYDSAAKINLPPQKRKIGYLFQQYALFPHMTVRQNIAAAIQERSRRESKTAELLRRFQLEDAAEKRPRQLSGGQQQRTALARILASGPKAILLDEPFSALDSYLKYQLEMELTDTLDSFSGTVIWVSHDRGEVFRNCNRVCVLDGGKSQPVSTLDELYRAPATEAAARLSGCKNYADIIPAGENVNLPAWGLTLYCGRTVPAAARRVGIRAHHVELSEPGAENAFPCRIMRVIRDMFTTIVLLRPEGAASDAPLLRMELNPSAWAIVEKTGGKRIFAAVRPENILLLTSSPATDFG